MPREFLLLSAYVQELTAYRVEELHACARTCGTTVEVLDEASIGDTCIIRALFESEEKAREIAARMVLLKGVFEVWGEGATYDEVVEQAKNGCAAEKKAPYCDVPFRFVFDAFGAKISFDEKVQRFNRFGVVGLNGPVEMKDPKATFWIIEDRGIPTTMRKGDNAVRRIYFARQVGLGNRKVLDRFSLKTRAYIGTTTMVPELCCLMANIAGVQQHSTVWDPFCGTGSTLVSAANLGATCFGSDLDGRALGNMKDGGILSNCTQYGFQPFNLMRLDLSQSCWRKGATEFLDAIISDPPYGRRESRKRIDEETQERIEKFVEELTPEAKRARKDTSLKTYIPPPKTDYGMGDLLTDLVDKAAQLLSVGGRLVYWHPTTAEYDRSELASHPCLKLISDVGQSVSIRLKRRLVVMEKVRSWTAEDRVVGPSVKEGQLDFNYKAEEGDSAAFEAYKAKRDKVREAKQKHRAEHGIEKRPPMPRAERRRLQQEAIERKKVRRAEAHEASRVKSLEITRLEREKRRLEKEALAQAPAAEGAPESGAQ